MQVRELICGSGMGEGTGFSSTTGLDSMGQQFWLGQVMGHCIIPVVCPGFYASNACISRSTV